MKKDYGVTLKVRTGTHKPVTRACSANERSQIVMDEARKVIQRHAKVIKALAKR